jgi:hypothetical protein
MVVIAIYILDNSTHHRNYVPSVLNVFSHILDISPSKGKLPVLLGPPSSLSYHYFYGNIF